MRQPRDALTPSAFSVEAAEKCALDRAAPLPVDHFRLRALWSVSLLLQAEPDERKTRYTMRIAQAEGYGRSGGHNPGLPDPDPDLVGEDTRRILEERLWRNDGDRAAIVDLVIGHVSRPADEWIVLDDTLRGKYVARTKIFADEADRVLQRRSVEHRSVNQPHVLRRESTGTEKELEARRLLKQREGRSGGRPRRCAPRGSGDHRRAR